MTTQTFYRKADVSKADALKDLLARHPNADVLKFVAKKANAETAKAAKVKPGTRIYEASVRLADFPPADDEGSDSEDSGSDDGGDSEPKAESKPEPKDDGDDSGSSDSGPPSDGGDGGDLGEPKKMSTDEQIVHLLQKILDAVSGGGIGGPKPHGGPEGGDLLPPDLGGGPDDLGGAAPPPPAGGPGAAGAPLPPPAKPKGLGGAPAAFSKFNPSNDKVVLVREGVTGGVTTTSIKEEAEELFPTHKVARITRRGEQVINGSPVNLPKAELAVVTLVKK